MAENIHPTGEEIERLNARWQKWESRKAALAQLENKELTPAAQAYFERLYPNASDLPAFEIIFENFKNELEKTVQEESLNISIATDGNYSDTARDLLKWLLKMDGSLNPRKSIFLFGELGVGKTTLIKALQKIAVKLFNYGIERKFRVINMDKVLARKTATNDMSFLENIGTGSICFDDLRKEHVTINHFGQFELLNLLLTNRYEAWKVGLFTIITTNVPPEEIKKHMDDVSADRLKQMFEFVLLRGSNKRHLT